MWGQGHLHLFLHTRSFGKSGANTVHHSRLGRGQARASSHFRGGPVRLFFITLQQFPAMGLSLLPPLHIMEPKITDINQRRGNVCFYSARRSNSVSLSLCEPPDPSIAAPARSSRSFGTEEMAESLNCERLRDES